MSTSRPHPLPGLPPGAILRTPESRRLALIGLPGAFPSTADQPLFTHLARVLVAADVALLTYDRRPAAVPGEDTAIAEQADDARAAAAGLRCELGVPVCLIGFSQGAWVAVEAADDETAAVVLLGFSAVSPAEQMRHACDEALRRRGFSDNDRAALRRTRLAVEDALRGGEPGPAVRLLAEACDQPWFELAALPPALPPGVRWHDLDHDPRPALARLTCPVLAVWGEDEECVPVDAGRAALPLADQVLLPGCGHWPAEDSGAPGFTHDRPDVPFSTMLEEVLTSWLKRI